MSEKSKIEMDELLNAMVDGEATDRQKVEFDRLLRHDVSIAKRLAAMQRQRQILGALPVEAAPVSLVDDVLSELERKQILGEVPSAQPTIVGTSHLLMRRILTTAAMLLLPIGILSFVVYEIIKPPTVGPVDYPTVGSRLVQNGTTASGAPSNAKELPFDGILTFRTQQPMTVSNYAEKIIFDQGLVRFTVPNRTADSSTYQITAPPEKIAVLIDSLANIWSHCQVGLSIANQTQDSYVDIRNVQAEQIKALAMEDSPEMLTRLAGQYASANIKKERVFAKDDKPANSEIDLVDSLPMRVPILTGRNEPAVNAVDPALPTVRLRIQVERAAE